MTQLFLAPGEIWFGGADVKLRTLLGSCIALTVWHPQRRIGGLCHVMLPARLGVRTKMLDARFADEAFAMMVQNIAAHHTVPEEYHAKLFGGGNMFPTVRTARGAHSVAKRNIQACFELAQCHGLDIRAKDVGGVGSRYLVFDLATGDVWVRRTASISAESTAGSK